MARPQVKCLLSWLNCLYINWNEYFHVKMYFTVMKGTRCKRNLIITIIKTRPQEIHKATFFQATRDLKTSFLSARARWESSSPIVTVWRHFVLLTNGKSRAVQTRRQTLYRSAKPLFPSSYKHHHIQFWTFHLWTMKR